MYKRQAPSARLAAVPSACSRATNCGAPVPPRTCSSLPVAHPQIKALGLVSCVATLINRRGTHPQKSGNTVVVPSQANSEQLRLAGSRMYSSTAENRMRATNHSGAQFQADTPPCMRVYVVERFAGRAYRRLHSRIFRCRFSQPARVGGGAMLPFIVFNGLVRCRHGEQHLLWLRGATWLGCKLIPPCDLLC